MALTCIFFFCRRHELAEELYMLQASLAAIYDRQGELDQALKHYDSAIRQTQRTRKKDDEASCYMYKAKVMAFTEMWYMYM